MKLRTICLLGLLAALLWTGPAEAETPSDFYCPLELRNNDFDDPAARWCWARSMGSEHFRLFWEAGFGDDPNDAALPAQMRVDATALLAKAERFWRTNRRLGFLPKDAPSQTDRYSMQIYLMYQSEWLAVGSGYDDVIGALWVNPGACADAGATLAHEIGHCFQYQVYCDQLLNGTAHKNASGFRYAPGSGNGNGFWEQCAQWQAYQDFPEEAFAPWDMKVWLANSHRHFGHEWIRYQSYWLMDALAQAHGEAAVGTLWRESVVPEDALAACLRMFLDGDIDRLNDEMYDYAARCATFDFDGRREYAGEWIGRYRTACYPAGEATWQVGYASCPSASGFTVTELMPLNAGAEVTVSFEGLPWAAALAGDDPGVWHRGEDGATEGGVLNHYNPLPEWAGRIAQGWRWGLVTLLQDGKRVYGPESADASGVLHWSGYEPGARLFLVVLGAPDTWIVQPWDDDERTDIQLPYRFRLENAIPVLP